MATHHYYADVHYDMLPDIIIEHVCNAYCFGPHFISQRHNALVTPSSGGDYSLWLGSAQVLGVLP